jgi:hypothetical protein
MSKPLNKAYSRTMFIVEGISTAMLVTHGRRMTSRSMQFATPEAALAWCRRHRAGLVYTPVDPARN